MDYWVERLGGSWKEARGRGAAPKTIRPRSSEIELLERGLIVRAKVRAVLRGRGADGGPRLSRNVVPGLLLLDLGTKHSALDYRALRYLGAEPSGAPASPIVTPFGGGEPFLGEDALDDEYTELLGKATYHTSIEFDRDSEFKLPVPTDALSVRLSIEENDYRLHEMPENEGTSKVYDSTLLGLIGRDMLLDDGALILDSCAGDREEFWCWAR